MQRARRTQVDPSCIRSFATRCKDEWGRTYPLPKERSYDVYMKHIEDGLSGLTQTADKLGVMVRPGVPRSLGLITVAEIPPREHNEQLLNALYGKERIANSQFPSGTVLWFEGPVLGLKEATRVTDVAAMRDSCFFQGNSGEAWYINGRVRFYAKVMRTHRGVEVAPERVR